MRNGKKKERNDRKRKEKNSSRAWRREIERSDEMDDEDLAVVVIL